VVGLRQSEETDKMNYPIRQSGSVFIRVPQPHQEMRRITRMGGKIVSIQPVNVDNERNGKAPSVTNSEVNGKAKTETELQPKEEKASP